MSSTSYDIYINLDDSQLERIKNFPNGMGNVAHNIAIMLAPYDTGNLRSAIFLSTNTPKRIVLTYSHMIANYLKFLEEGLGPVKKYIGFISVDTKISITDALLGWIETGIIPPYTSVPIVDMRSTTNIFTWEQDLLKAVNKNSNEISPNVRKKISMIREINYRQTNGINSTNIPRKGRATLSKRTIHLEGSNGKLGRKVWGSVAIGSNKGSSELSKAYSRIKQGRLIE